MSNPESAKTLEKGVSHIQKQAEAYRALARHFAGAAEAFKVLHRLTEEDAQKR